MAKIPTGNFGRVVAGPQPMASGAGAIGEGLAQLGRTARHVSNELHEQRQREAAARAGTQALDDELQVKSKAQDVIDKIDDGSMHYDEARRAFDDEVGTLPREHIDGLEPVAAEALARQRKRVEFVAGAAVDRAAEIARRREFKGQFSNALDTLDKLAGLPDADIEDINRKAEAFRQLGRDAGLPPDELERTLQAFKDKNWLNQATQRSMEARNDMGALKSLEHELVDAKGFYANKLDTNSRNAVLRGVQADRDRLEQRVQVEADRHLARAERAIGAIDRQIASGVPATSEMWAHWASEVKGTDLSGEFQDRLQDERDVQDLLKHPIDAQVKFVQDREAKLLQSGGTVRDAANVQRLREAVKTNVNLLQNAPLIFSQNRTGKEFAPIDIASFGTPEGTEAIAGQLRERMVELGALRRQYGPAVQMRPLLPQEASALATMIDAATPRQAVEMYSGMRQTLGGDETFRSVMQQIVPDSPVRALAGMLAAKERSLTLERNWIADDVLASSKDVAATMLTGDEILNRSKGDKATDGKPQNKLFLPEDRTLQDEFVKQVGGLFAGRPGAADIGFQAVRAYYVGKAAQTGRLARDQEDIDAKLVREAVHATLGNVVDYNGNGEVLAPWGMDESTFEDRVQAAFLSETKRRGMGEAAPKQIGALGLRNLGDGSYYVVQGRNFVYDKKGEPLVINVLQ